MLEGHTSVRTNINHVENALDTGYSCPEWSLVTVQPVISRHSVLAWPQYIDAIERGQELSCAPQMLKHLHCHQKN